MKHSNNSVNSDAQLRCVPLGAGYAEYSELNIKMAITTENLLQIMLFNSNKFKGGKMIGFTALCSLISFIAAIVIFPTAKSDIREIEGFSLFLGSTIVYVSRNGLYVERF